MLASHMADSVSAGLVWFVELALVVLLGLKDKIMYLHFIDKIIFADMVQW